MRKKLIIAIDGPAASGKSTTAKKLAQNLSYIYIDTGAMYRAVALAALQSGISLDDDPKLLSLLDGIKIDFHTANGQQKVVLNGKDVSERIRIPDITKLSSEIAVNPLVRKKLVSMQQEMGQNGGVVMDGRDIGTIVFPDADLKFFLTADTKVRALRRWKELPDKSITLDEVEKDLIWRDNNDSTRKTGPLVQAADGIPVDTTEMSISEQIDYIYKIVAERL